VTAIAGVVFSGSLDGVMRAYDSRDGRIIWEFNTRQSFPTINGVEGRGGGINGPGPVIAGGVLYVNSGYGAIGGAPGNVLLAFAADWRETRYAEIQKPGAGRRSPRFLTGVANYSATTLTDTARAIDAYRTFKSNPPEVNDIAVFKQMLSPAQKPYKP
jgi:PQQ enzyme repeat